MIRGILSLLLLTGLSAPVSAARAAAGGGSEAGNGGSAIVCRDSAGGVTSVEMLDFYEGRQIYGYQVDLGRPELTPEEKVEFFLKRLAERGLSGHRSVEEPLRAALFKFKESARFYSGTRLVEVPDSASLILPAGCTQEQIAVQRRPLFDGNEKYFTINRDLWDHPSFDSNQKAGLILHEVFYYLSLNNPNDGKRETRDSRKVRHFVAKHSDPSIPRSIVDFALDLDSINFGMLNVHGYACHVDAGLDYFFSDEIMQCRTEIFPITFQGRERHADAAGFDKDGRLEAVQFVRPEFLQVRDQELWFKQKHWVYFDREGRILRGALAFDEEVRFQEGTRLDLVLAGDGGDAIEVIFGIEGNLLGCQACRGTFTSRSGHPLRVAPHPDPSRRIDRWSLLVANPAERRYFSFVLAGEQPYPLDGQTAYFQGRLLLHSDESVFEGTLARPYSTRLGDAPLTLIGHLNCTEDGKPLQGTLAESARLRSCDGDIRKYLKGMELHFSQEDACVENVMGLPQ